MAGLKPVSFANKEYSHVECLQGYVLNFKTKIRLTTRRPVLFGLLIVPYARIALMHLCCDKKIYMYMYIDLMKVDRLYLVLNGVNLQQPDPALIV